MAQLEVKDWSGKSVGSVELPADIYERPISKPLLQKVVKWQLAKRRQGTHMAKTRSNVSGGGAKPYKQKGTGNARRGSSRSPLIRGGGVIFGPTPRDYSYSLPKKIRLAGLKTALSYLHSEGKLQVIDNLSSKDGKTKDYAKKLSGLGLKKSLLVSQDTDGLTARASQNLSKFVSLPVEGVNVYDLLKYDHVLIEKDSFEKLNVRLGAQA